MLLSSSLCRGQTTTKCILKIKKYRITCFNPYKIDVVKSEIIKKKLEYPLEINVLFVNKQMSQNVAYAN